MLNKERGVAKIFAEMPWLWSIFSSYTRETPISVESLMITYIWIQWIDPDQQWWAKVQSDTGERVVELPGERGESLAQRILKMLELELGPGWQYQCAEVTHLLSRSKDGHYKVYRPGKSVSIVRACSA